MTDRNLRVALANWHGIAPPSFISTSVCSLDFTEKPFFFPLLHDYVKQIIFVGSNRGVIGRWYVANGGVHFMGFQFGHDDKIVSLQKCCYPIIFNAVVSLSLDGTICVWSVVDGICFGKYDCILPEGCQSISVSKANYELAAVSGSFVNVYIVNIVTGEIAQTIPVHYYIISLSFYNEGDEEWLLTSAGKGIVSFISVNEKTSSIAQVRLFNTQEILKSDIRTNQPILRTFPSPNYEFIILVFNTGYAIVSLTLIGLPSIFIPNDKISTAIWVSTNIYYIMEMNGNLIRMSIESPVPDFSFGEYIKKTMSKSNLSSHDNNNGHTNVNRLQSNTIDHLSFLSPLTILPSINQSPKVLHQSLKKSPSNEFKSSTQLKEPAWLHSIDGVGLFCPLATSFEEKIVLVINEKIIIESLDFAEASLCSSFESPDKITCQNFLVDKNEIIATLFGNANGEIIIKYFSDTNQVIIKAHETGITALLSTKGYIISAGDDCQVHIYKIDKGFPLVDSICLFTSPVVKILSVASKTNTIVDDYIFCVTRNKLISVYSLRSCSHVFVLSGHDYEIYDIFFHPSTMMLIVESKSLYLWSLATGDLETIMTGQKKAQFQNNIKKHTVKIDQHMVLKNGITLRYITLGGLSIFVEDINVNEIASTVSQTLQKYNALSFEQALHHVPNLPTTIDMLKGNSFQFLRKYAKAPDLTYAFVGSNGALSMWSPNIIFTRENIWQISSMVSAIVLSTHSIMTFAFRKHPDFSKLYPSITTLNPTQISHNIKDFVNPSLAHVFLFLSTQTQEAYEYLVSIIRTYPEEIRLEWLSRLKESFKCFPRLKTQYGLVYSVIASTLDQISEEDFSSAIHSLLVLLADDRIKEFIRYIIRKSTVSFIKSFDGGEITDFLSETSMSLIADDPFITSYLSYKPSVFFKTTIELAKRKESKLATIMIQYLISALIDKKVSTVFVGTTASTILQTFELLGNSDIKEGLKKLTNETSWFAFNPEKDQIAYGTPDGVVVFVQKRLVGFARISMTVCDTAINYIGFNKNGTLLIALSHNFSTIYVYSIVSTIIEDVEHINLVLVFTFTYKTSITISWVSNRSISISGDDLPERVIEFTTTAQTPAGTSSKLVQDNFDATKKINLSKPSLEKTISLNDLNHHD